MVVVLGTVGAVVGGVVRATPAIGRRPPSAHAALPISLTWQQTLPDAGGPIAQSSPSVATLDGGGPSVVVGDRSGNLWAFHLNNGTRSQAGRPTPAVHPSTRRRR